MTLKEKVTGAIHDIIAKWKDPADTRDWAVAWSGGKDSTVALSLLVKATEIMSVFDREKRTVRVIMSDTRVENPILAAYMHDQVAKFKKYVEREELPFTVEIVSRPVEKSYFVLTIGRGYFLPLNNGQGRWCTGRLKLEPQNAALEAVNPSHIVIGARSSESTSRERSINKFTIDDKIGRHANLTETNTFMVIVDWTVEDVWSYLGTVNLGWTTARDVRDLYKEATGECGVNNPVGLENKLRIANAEACGARFGCWLCPVITTDKSTEEMAKYHGWLEPLSDYREMQMKVYGAYKPEKPEGQSRKDRSAALRKQEAINEQINRITKCGYNRAGKRMKNGQGTFTVEARKYLFNYLMDVERLVNRLRDMERLPPMELITEEEKNLIYDLWAEDYADYPHTVTNAEGISIDALDDLVDGRIDESLVADYIARREANKKSKE